MMDEVLNETEKRVMTLHYGHDMRSTRSRRRSPDQHERRQSVHRQRQTKVECSGEAMEREILRTALAPSAECLSIEQLGRYADGALGTDEQTAASCTFAAVSTARRSSRCCKR